MRQIYFVLLTASLVFAASPAPAQITPEAPATDHLSTTEQQNLARVQQIHAPGLGLIQRLRDSGLLLEDAEWWVAGPRDILPFAGSWTGLEGVAEFQKRLGETMKYDKVEIKQYLVSGNDVAAIFMGTGVARATGAPFESEIVRLYSFREGKIIRVRNYYDTASYVKAVTATRN
jgi:uncharacterized protein